MNDLWKAVEELYNAGRSISAIASELGVSCDAVYRYLKKLKENSDSELMSAMHDMKVLMLESDQSGESFMVLVWLEGDQCRWSAERLDRECLEWVRVFIWPAAFERDAEWLELLMCTLHKDPRMMTPIKMYHVDKKEAR